VFLLLVLGSFFVGCSPRSLEDYQATGEQLSAKIALELSSIHCAKDLEHKRSSLKKQFRKLAKLMVEAAEYHRKHEDQEIDRLNLHPTSDRLCYEFLRITSDVEGGKLFLEELQHEMLDRLDVDSRKHQKTKRTLK
jgi:hypothetical protein